MWLKVIKSELIEETIEKARTRTAGFEAGLRNDFATLYRNKKEMKRFTADEKEAIREVSAGNFSQNVLRRLGSLSPGSGQQRNSLSLGMGAASGAYYGSQLGGPVGGGIGAIAVPALGYGAQKTRGTRRTEPR